VIQREHLNSNCHHQKGNNMAETTSKAIPKKSATKTATTSTKPAAKKPAAKPIAAVAKPAAKKAPAKTAVNAAENTAPAKKPVAAKPRAPASVAGASATVILVSDEQRYRMVAEAAYFRAESHQFKSDPVRDWIEAEGDVAALLNSGKQGQQGK
jgi:hypothetical protein